MTLLPSSISQHHADYFSIIELSDLHLFDDPNKLMNGVNTADTFESVLSLVKQQRDNVDLLVLTGDLCHEPTPKNYDRLFAALDDINIPFVAIPGNHDVTLELDHHLPFAQRRHLPVKADSRLQTRYSIATDYWDLLLLDSSCEGHSHGEFDEQSLRWLAQQLANADRPCAIFCHHPMVLIDSAWLDKYTIINSERFWEVVMPYLDRIKAIFVGHIHQEMHKITYGTSVFGCPSTSLQFKPLCKDYTIDEIAPGLRWINLYNNGLLATGIKRTDTI